MIGAVGAIILFTLGYGITSTVGQTKAVVTDSSSTTSTVSTITTNTLVSSDASGTTSSTQTSSTSSESETSAPVIPSDLSPGLADVVKLVQAHISDDVIVNYINGSNIAYQPTANELIYLNDLGVSEAVVNAIVQHSAKPEVQTATAPVSQTATADQNAVPTATATATPTGAYATASVSTTAATATAEPAVATAYAPPQTVAAAPASETTYAQPAPEAQVATAAPVAAAAPVVVATPPPVTVVDFQTGLAPYGTWINVEGYGMCWQPTVVVASPDWQPYCNGGHWVYTDAGWYWQSDYSWGWAPFHYGRWYHHPHHGWVWTPDTVWGPAWVCWRHHDAYCGWAPLPPTATFEVGIGWSYHHNHVGVDFDFGLGVDCFTFVSFGHFQDHRIDHFRVPHHDMAPIFRASRMRNEGRFERGCFINEGPGRSRIVAVTHHNIEPVHINHQVGPGPGGIGRDHVAGGHSLTVYHPQPAGNRPGGNSPAHAVTINGPTHQSPGARPGAGAPVSHIATPSNPRGNMGAGNNGKTSNAGLGANPQRGFANHGVQTGQTPRSSGGSLSSPHTSTPASGNFTTSPRTQAAGNTRSATPATGNPTFSHTPTAGTTSPRTATPAVGTQTMPRTTTGGTVTTPRTTTPMTSGGNTQPRTTTPTTRGVSPSVPRGATPVTTGGTTTPRTTVQPTGGYRSGTVPSVNRGGSTPTAPRSTTTSGRSSTPRQTSPTPSNGGGNGGSGGGNNGGNGPQRH